MNAQTRQKALFSVAAIGVLATHAIWPRLLTGDSLTLVLLIAAVLPWLDTVFPVAELPGGWKFQFKEVKTELSRQQELINALVKYSMSASIFHHLCGIALLYRYAYIDNDGNRREMYFLRDNGFIRPRPGQPFLDFGPTLDRQNLAAIAEPTPIGWECVRLRKLDVPENMRADAANLRVPLDSV